MLGDAGVLDYQSLVGTLIYASTTARPDVSYAVGRLARTMHAPSSGDLDAAYDALEYLNQYPAECLTYSGRGTPLNCMGYTDASYAGEKPGRKSTIGQIFMTTSGTISWKTKTTPLTVLSSAEAELVALCQGVKEAIFIRGLMCDIGRTMRCPMWVLVDNEAVLAMAQNVGTSDRTKHIAVRYFFIREKIGHGFVRLHHCPTDQMAADLYTKALSGEKFFKFSRVAFSATKHVARLLSVLGGIRTVR